MTAAEPIRAPHGAVGWTPDAGFLHSEEAVVEHVARDAVVLMVSADGLVRGVQPHDHAPLAAVVRIDARLDDVVARLDDVGDRAEALDVAEAMDVSGMWSVVNALTQRVRQLESRTR